MPRFDTIAPGKTPIAAYQSILELGRGGMGTVHLARAVGAGGFERLVVVKRLNRELLDQPDAVRRFLDEARHAALIHHANVVGIHQIGRDDEGYFLVLDYVEGTSLDGLVDLAAVRGERVPPPIVLRIGLDALAGLQAAHQAEDATGKPLELLHRDVSLQNVLVGRDGVSRIADFGIAKSTLASVVTDSRYMLGKLLYSPPEYLRRQGVGPTLDVYALGVTLWIAFAGTDPYPESDEAQLLVQILNQPIPRLSESGIQIAPQVDDLVAKACEYRADDRFQTAREMGAAIEAIGRDTGWLASHADVSAYVEAQFGLHLRERREQVAFFVEQARANAPVYESVAPPPERPMEPTRPRRALQIVDTSAIAVPVPAPAPAPASKVPLVIAAVALGAAGLGALIWARASNDDAPKYQPVAASSSPAAPAMAAGEERRAQASTPEAAAVVPAAEPRAVDPSTLPKEPTPATRRGRRPTATAATPSNNASPGGPPQTPVVTPIAPAPASPAETKPTSDGIIRKANPYR